MIRNFDLELIRGVGISILLAVVCYYLFRWFCYKYKTKIQLVQSMQEHWRPFLLIVGFLIPILNSCYFINSLAPFYEECYTALLLVLVAMGGEVLLYVLERINISLKVPKTIWNVSFYVLRFLLYFLLVNVAYRNMLQQEIIEGGFFVASCYTAAVYMVLKFAYNFVFEDINFKNELLKAIINRIKMPCYVLVCILTAMYAWTWAPSTFKKTIDLIKYLDIALAIDLCTVALESIFILIFDYYLTKIKSIVISKLIQDLSRLIAYVILLLVILSTAFNVNLSSLLVSSTVISVIVGLALQESMGNFVAGILLDFAQPYKTGDYVEIGGVAGRVESIDWRSTVLRLVTGECNVLPNSIVAKSTVKNYSFPTSRQARSFVIGIAYDHSPDLVRRVILQAIDSVSEVLKDPKPVVWLIDFADSSMNYKVFYWIEDFSCGLTIDSKVRESVWYYLKRENINIPYPITSILENNEPSVSNDTEIIKEFISRLDIMQGASEAYVSACAQNSQIKLYGPGECLYPKDNLGNKDIAAIVKKGRLRMTMLAKGEEQTKETKKIDLGTGDIFSEILADSQHFETKVYVVEEAELVTFTSEQISRLFKLYPESKREIAKHFGIQ
ncbi:MAG: mechanosensitive ion channel domain-containing protein [Candidatus Bruticola sp.]